MDDLGTYAKLLGLVVAFFALIAGANGLVYWRFTREGWKPFSKPDTPRPRYAFADDRSARFKGGALIGFRNSSRPFVTLQADERWASVVSTFDRDVWIDRGTVSEVAAVRRGVMFRSADGTYDGLIFWCTPAVVLDTFARLGWPVAAPALPPPPPPPR